jgi:hypothetical protein
MVKSGTMKEETVVANLEIMTGHLPEGSGGDLSATNVRKA